MKEGPEPEKDLHRRLNLSPMSSRPAGNKVRRKLGRGERGSHSLSFSSGQTHRGRCRHITAAILVKGEFMKEGTRGTFIGGGVGGGGVGGVVVWGGGVKGIFQGERPPFEKGNRWRRKPVENASSLSTSSYNSYITLRGICFLISFLLMVEVTADKEQPRVYRRKGVSISNETGKKPHGKKEKGSEHQTDVPRGCDLYLSVTSASERKDETSTGGVPDETCQMGTFHQL